jgi:hypothetical protein
VVGVVDPRVLGGDHRDRVVDDGLAGAALGHRRGDVVEV